MFLLKIGSVPGSQDIAVGKTDKVASLMEFTF